jgi:hypothetical protein
MAWGAVEAMRLGIWCLYTGKGSSVRVRHVMFLLGESGRAGLILRHSDGSLHAVELELD